MISLRESEFPFDGQPWPDLVRKLDGAWTSESINLMQCYVRFLQALPGASDDRRLTGALSMLRCRDDLLTAVCGLHEFRRQERAWLELAGAAADSGSDIFELLGPAIRLLDGLLAAARSRFAGQAEAVGPARAPGPLAAKASGTEPNLSEFQVFDEPSWLELVENIGAAWTMQRVDQARSYVYFLHEFYRQSKALAELAEGRRPSRPLWGLFDDPRVAAALRVLDGRRRLLTVPELLTAFRRGELAWLELTAMPDRAAPDAAQDIFGLLDGAQALVDDLLTTARNRAAIRMPPSRPDPETRTPQAHSNPPASPSSEISVADDKSHEIEGTDESQGSPGPGVAAQ